MFHAVNRIEVFDTNGFEWEIAWHIKVLREFQIPGILVQLFYAETGRSIRHLLKLFVFVQNFVV